MKTPAERSADWRTKHVGTSRAQLNFYLETGTYNALKRLARYRSVTMTQILEEMITETEYRITRRMNTANRIEYFAPCRTISRPDLRRSPRS